MSDEQYNYYNKVCKMIVKTSMHTPNYFKEIKHSAFFEDIDYSELNKEEYQNTLVNNDELELPFDRCSTVKTANANNGWINNLLSVKKIGKTKFNCVNVYDADGLCVVENYDIDITSMNTQEEFNGYVQNIKTLPNADLENAVPQDFCGSVLGTEIVLKEVAVLIKKKWRYINFHKFLNLNMEEIEKLEKNEDAEIFMRFKYNVENSYQYSIRFITILNLQQRFIFEQNVSKRVGKKKTTRTTYHTMVPRKFRNLINVRDPKEVENPRSSLRHGHERRAHWRYYRSDRFVNMKGKRIRIAATWIGPTSFTDPKDPNKKYKVRVDL